MRPALLEGYLDTLSWQLPGPVVEELADGPAVGLCWAVVLVRWAAAAAMTASVARLVLSVRLLRPILAWGG